MGLFISYSSQDRSSIEDLTAALRRGQQQVWFDQELGGGDSWWNLILEKIRSCDVFIVALSNNWLQSKPCQSELRYAQALQRPILPIRIGVVDSVRVNPLASLQIINYENPTVDAGIQLVTAVHTLQAKPAPLPEPLPAEPPVPFAYLMRVGDKLGEKELSPQQQLQLLVELKSGLDEDGDDPSARSDIAQLLRMLRLRHDVTFRTRGEIDSLLASIESDSVSPSDATQPAPITATGPRPVTTASAESTQPVDDVGAGKAQPSRKRWIIAAGGGLAAVIAVVIVVCVTVLSSSKPTTPSAASSAAPSAGPASSANLDSILLSPGEVSDIMGAPNMQLANHALDMRRDQGKVSNPDCLGALEPIQDSVYRGTGYTGVRGQGVLTSGDDPFHRVYEAVVDFPSAGQAAAFVNTSADKWRGCANQTVTINQNDKTLQWNFGQLTQTGAKITQVHTKVNPSGNSCQRVLSAVSDKVIDVVACGPQINDEGSRIADQMATTVAH